MAAYGITRLGAGYTGEEYGFLVGRLGVFCDGCIDFLRTKFFFSFSLKSVVSLVWKLNIHIKTILRMA